MAPGTATLEAPAQAAHLPLTSGPPFLHVPVLREVSQTPEPCVKNSTTARWSVRRLQGGLLGSAFRLGKVTSPCVWVFEEALPPFHCPGDCLGP